MSVSLKFFWNSPLWHIGAAHVLTLNSAFRVMAGSHLSKEGLLEEQGSFPLVSLYCRQMCKNLCSYIFFHISTHILRSRLYLQYSLFLPPLVSFWETSKVTWWRSLKLSRSGLVILGLRVGSRCWKGGLKGLHSVVNHTEVLFLPLPAQSFQRSKRKVSAKVKNRIYGHWELWPVYSLLRSRRREAALIG